MLGQDFFLKAFPMHGAIEGGKAEHSSMLNSRQGFSDALGSWLFSSAGSPERAMSHYRQAILLSPAHHVAMVNLGRLHRSLGHNKEAEVWYKR